MNNYSDISATPTKKEKNKEKRKKGHIKDDSVVFKSAEESKKNMKYDSSSRSISPSEKVNKKNKLKDGSHSSTLPAENVNEEKNVEDDSSSSRMAEKQKKRHAHIEKKKMKIKDDSPHTTASTTLAEKEKKRKKTKAGSNTPDVSEKDENNKKKKKRRHVSFSSAVEIFPLENQEHDKDEKDDDNDSENKYTETLVRGIRFSLEEDQKIKDAIDKYITIHQLGEKGIHMVLHCNEYPAIRRCWKEIAACLPHRPKGAVYNRAHTILERSEKRYWDPEECEIIRRFYNEHGAKWKELAGQIRKQRIHVKDTWRRIRHLNRKRGPWTQDEYQTLFDLVNFDLRLKASEEKQPSDRIMIRENVPWEAVSDKLTTRSGAECCHKWYGNLSSPMVQQGLWVDSDDYRLIAALQKIDACCFEDVDWDNLLEHRSGEICRKRWVQMVRGIGFYKVKPFTEQVEILATRYCPDVLPYRK